MGILPDPSGMRHGERGAWIDGVLLLAATTCYLAGLGWVVQLVVYPAFRLVGPEQWPVFHAHHSRAITWAVGPVWAVQGVATAAVLLQRQDAAALALGLLAAVPVGVTVASAVPAHERLGQQDPVALARLQRAHAVRTAAWTLGAVLAVLLVSRA